MRALPLLLAQVTVGTFSLQSFLILLFVLIVVAVALTFIKPYMEPKMYQGIIILIALALVGFLLFWVIGAVG